MKRHSPENLLFAFVIFPIPQNWTDRRRRCRTETAVTRLGRLRQRVRRFTQLCQAVKTLCSTNLDNALTFLDDRLLPAISNAVERGNRVTAFNSCCKHELNAKGDLFCPNPPACQTGRQFFS